MSIAAKCLEVYLDRELGKLAVGTEAKTVEQYSALWEVPTSLMTELLSHGEEVYTCGDRRAHKPEPRTIAEMCSEAFLSWFNDFLSIERFAEYHGIDVPLAKEVVEFGRLHHEANVAKGGL